MTVLQRADRAVVCRFVWPRDGTPLAPSRGFVSLEERMSWFYLALVVVMGFALLKVRRRRKAAQTRSYVDSKAA